MIKESESPSKEEKKTDSKTDASADAEKERIRLLRLQRLGQSTTSPNKPTESPNKEEGRHTKVH